MSSSAEERILLNQIARGIVPLSEGEEWFRRLPPDRGKSVLRELSAMALQASFVPGDIAAAVERFGLVSGWTPCVLLGTGRPKVQMAKVLALPRDESERVFKLLIGLFSVADQRRRERCGEDCRHWWHSDLSDEDNVKRLLDSGAI